MWPKFVIGVVAFKIMFNIVNASSHNPEKVRSLPYCPNTNRSGAVLVSTLDGKLSAINSSGHLSWEIETGPGPLLLSNIHKLELTNNGEWIRIIPSLTGNLYKFDGNTIDPISISAETLLASSFRYSDDLVIAGGIEVRTYGVGFRTGKLFYECSQSKCSNRGKEEMEDVMVIERSTQTIRAVEPRTGYERWNFSVGLHNIKLPQVSCMDTKMFDSNISVVIPEGLLSVSPKINNMEEHNWQYKFHSPIVRVWRWDGMKLSEINLFDPKSMPALIAPTPVLPSIYIGMHEKQLYIHESFQMQSLLQGRQKTELVPAESNSLTKIPWKPISASSERTEDDSTALSILNNSEYVNGNGYYLFTEQAIEEKNIAQCERNDSKIIDAAMPIEEEIIYKGLLAYLSSYSRYYKECLFMVFAIVLNPFLLKIWNKNNRMSVKSEGFSSRFTDDFKLIQCLGKGGFGIVFQVKQKYDDCDYAIKRITLPNEEESRDRVMREVKALAKLDHKNIIRYFSCWVESPPPGWEQEEDTNYFDSEDPSSVVSVVTENANFPTKDYETTLTEDEDSFIIFAEDTSASIHKDITLDVGHSVGNKTVKVNETEAFSDHLQKKINWKRPGRKSWDLSSSVPIRLRDPPVYLYIQMQLCQKESLKEWLSLHTERNYSEMLQFFLQILDAVEYVHLSKLIHRDLKPSNIFFSLDGQIKVGDFGLVKDIESSFDLELCRRNTTGSRRGHTKDVGTTLYMSPEQSNGRIYDYKVDIYSLGIILFELLVPFSTEMERIKTLTNVKSKKFPTGFENKYPAEFALLHNMLDEDPKKRFTTSEIRAKHPFTQNNNVVVHRDPEKILIKTF